VERKKKGLHKSKKVLLGMWMIGWRQQLACIWSTRFDHQDNLFSFFVETTFGKWWLGPSQGCQKYLKKTLKRSVFENNMGVWIG